MFEGLLKESGSLKNDSRIIVEIKRRIRKEVKMHHFAKQLNLLLILPAVLSSTYKGIINEKDINITNIISTFQDRYHLLIIYFQNRLS